MTGEQLERRSSAVTLSDMEIFVFPELMYSLVLADIMSPVIWRWRERECFKKLEGKTSYRKLMRLKQFIMDEYEFNLDLETWGLTTKDRELKRFGKYISPEAIAQSNALFGYHGDEYYFDVDIRRHFGLDKYDSSVIPYWKTETVEAMDAFRYKAGYGHGAGECVSLAVLYVAAAFVVCRIPLEDIYMILTPLHSQNFIDMKGGILTNNRRLVTKTAWFNGTAISNKAQRALRNEQVTMVVHPRGYVHCMYEDCTMDRSTYDYFRGKLREYLSTDLSLVSFASFLRANRDYQKYFQVCRECHGQGQFLKAEVLFHYEHSSNYKIGDKTHDKLLAEVADEDFVNYELPGRVRCDYLEGFMEKRKPDLTTEEGRSALREFLSPVVPEAEQLVNELAEFIHIEPKLPSPKKNYKYGGAVEIRPEQSREEIIEYLGWMRSEAAVADLAFYAYRDMESCDWEPFVRAAVERNPVSLARTEGMSVEEVYGWLRGLKDFSIYEGKRLAQPDEVANYGTGDGLEKAFLLANVVREKEGEQQIELSVDKRRVRLRASKEYEFESDKGLSKEVTIR